MKHLQPYYNQAIRQILSENRLSALFDADQIFDALCSFPTPQAAGDYICILRNNEDFTWKKLEKCQEIALAKGWRKFEASSPESKCRILLQSISSRASNLKITAESKVRLTRNFGWTTRVVHLDEQDKEMLALFKKHYKLPEIPPFFPCDLSVLLKELDRKTTV